MPFLDDGRVVAAILEGIRNRDFLSVDDKRRSNRGSTLLSFRLFRCNYLADRDTTDPSLRQTK
jgi:hypothetical protein